MIVQFLLAIIHAERDGYFKIATVIDSPILIGERGQIV